MNKEEFVLQLLANTGSKYEMLMNQREHDKFVESACNLYDRVMARLNPDPVQEPMFYLGLDPEARSFIFKQIGQADNSRLFLLLEFDAKKDKRNAQWDAPYSIHYALTYEQAKMVEKIVKETSHAWVPVDSKPEEKAQLYKVAERLMCHLNMMFREMHGYDDCIAKPKEVPQLPDYRRVPGTAKSYGGYAVLIGGRRSHI